MIIDWSVRKNLLGMKKDISYSNPSIQPLYLYNTSHEGLERRCRGSPKLII